LNTDLLKLTQKPLQQLQPMPLPHQPPQRSLLLQLYQ
jgi:hypothetical protein